MSQSIKKIIKGYAQFKEKYTKGDASCMRSLANQGQKPEIMVIACCDSRVDPAIILQCDPGDLFVVRNVANIVPPYHAHPADHSVGTALEYGVCYLKVKHLVILGHSQCGGIDALLKHDPLAQDDFISNWVSQLDGSSTEQELDAFSKQAVLHAYQNCLTYPWIKERVLKKSLTLHAWFFDIKDGEVFTYSFNDGQYQPFAENHLLK